MATKTYNGLFPGIGVTVYNFADKETATREYVGYMLARAQSMFEYSGLPDTIPQRSLEILLQTSGHVCIAKINGDIYAVVGGMGGEPDAYYMPTEYVVSNPHLRFSANLKIGVDCVVIPSDSVYMGLAPMFSRYASLMNENDITMRILDINTRIFSLLSAPDDKTRAAAETYLKNVEAGKLGVIAENAFLEGIKAQPYASPGQNGGMTDLIEYQQYLKASWFNDLGLQANYNMKRESINSNEAQLNEDALTPLIDNMLNCRKQGVEAVNKMFGTNITVELSSTWKKRQEGEPADEEAEGAANEEDETGDVSGQPENEETEGGEEDELPDGNPADIA